MDFLRNTSTLSTFNKSLINNSLINSNDNSAKIALKAFNINDVKIALFILDNIDESCSCCSQDDNCNSVLHHLVLNSNNDECVRVLKKLLERSDVCQFINLQNSNGSTALHLAVSENKNDIADLLISASADMSIVNNEGLVVEKEGNRDRDSDSDSNENTDIFHSKSHADVNKRLVLNILINKNEPTTLGLNDTDTLENRQVERDTVDKFTKVNADDTVDVTDTVAELNGIIKRLEERVNENETKINENEREIKKHEAQDIATAHPPAPSNAPPSPSKSSFVSQPPPSPKEGVEEGEEKKGEEKKGEEEKEGDALNLLGGYVDNNDTDVFISKMTNKIKSLNEKIGIVNEQANILNEIQNGGETKLMGYRNLNTLQSKNIIKNKQESSKKVRENSLKKSRDYILTDSSELVGGNELERMINTRKNEMHNDVLNMIQDMLNKGEISQNKKPVEANERNAKLIKAFLYKMVSEKNPQMDGMNKISLIKDMKHDDIIDMLKKLPDLDKLEKEIQSHIEKKKANKKMQNGSDSEPKASKAPKAKAPKAKASKEKVSKKKQESTDSDMTDSDMTDSD